jgi:NitT/TauT family transport system permease protein
MSKTRQFISGALLQTAVCLLFLLIWQFAASQGSLNKMFFPDPLSVLLALKEIYQSGTLLQNIAASIFRVIVGFTLAALFAIPIGMLLGWYSRVGSALSLLIGIFRTISPIAWIPLAILWFGVGDAPAIFIIFMASFFPILIATMQAPKQVDPLMVKAAMNFGAKGNSLLRLVIFPASIPYIVIGLRIGLAIAWVVVVAAEMVGMRSGLGYLILDARNFLRTDMVIAGMIVIGIIGTILDLLMRCAEKSISYRKDAHGI